jgi:hypothetical protein
MIFFADLHAYLCRLPYGFDPLCLALGRVLSNDQRELMWDSGESDS